MFTHAFLGSNDIERSRKFYDATMKELGYQNVVPPEAGMANGGSDEGPPGPREYGMPIYAAYMRDPDGNKLCALFMSGDQATS